MVNKSAMKWLLNVLKISGFIRNTKGNILVQEKLLTCEYTIYLKSLLLGWLWNEEHLQILSLVTDGFHVLLNQHLPFKFVMNFNKFS